MAPDRTYLIAEEKAKRFAAGTYRTDADRQEAVKKLIIGALIDFEAGAQKVLCEKCSNSLIQLRRKGGRS